MGSYQESGKVCGLDGSPEMIAQAQHNAIRANLEVDFQLGLIETMPFPDNAFDVVVSRLVIHHLPGDLKQKGFAEMYRVLKPEGRFLIVDFAMPKLLRRLTNLHGMLRTDVQTYAKILAEVGFQELEVAPTNYPFLAHVRGKPNKRTL